MTFVFLPPNGLLPICNGIPMASQHGSCQSQSILVSWATCWCFILCLLVTGIATDICLELLAWCHLGGGLPFQPYTDPHRKTNRAGWIRTSRSMAEPQHCFPSWSCALRAQCKPATTWQQWWSGSAQGICWATETSLSASADRMLLKLSDIPEDRVFTFDRTTHCIAPWTKHLVGHVQ